MSPVVIAVGISYHVALMLGFHRERTTLRTLDLVHSESGFPTSLVLIVTVTLLLIGAVAVISMVGHVRPND